MARSHMHSARDHMANMPNRLLKYSPTCGLPPLALALFFRQVSVS